MKHSIPLLVLPLFVLGCPSTKQRCHDQADLEACLSLCADTDATCYRDLAQSTPTLTPDLLTRGCEARDALACVDLAQLREEGPERIELFDRACDLDSPQACRQLTELLLDADPQDWFAAIGATVRACHLLGLRGCADADRMEAQSLHQSFCLGESILPAPSCEELDPDGPFSPQDREVYDRIDQRVRLACEARDPGACALGIAWAEAGYARLKGPSPVDAAWFREREGT